MIPRPLIWHLAEILLLEVLLRYLAVRYDPRSDQRSNGCYDCSVAGGFHVRFPGTKPGSGPYATARFAATVLFPHLPRLPRRYLSVFARSSGGDVADGHMTVAGG